MPGFVANANMATSLLNLGLTPVHLAVLQDDLDHLITLIQPREYGIDTLDARRATPVMLAALAGRSTVFTYLWENGASLRREDSRGLTAIDYLRSANVQSLAPKYQPCAQKRFSDKRRKLIRATLKAFRQLQQGFGHEVGFPGPLVVPPPSQETITLPATSSGEIREVVVHKGNAVTFGRLFVQAEAQFTINLHKKTIGAIRGRAQDSPFHAMAISGWRGDQAVQGTTVLCNTKYTGLVKAVSRLYGLALKGNPNDKPFSGAAEEKVSTYYCCHTERQLSTWLVEECVFRLLATKSITVDNVSRVKQKLDMLPTELRETVIELDHTPCKYCIEYVGLLQNKSGLDIELKSRAWFVPGKRAPAPRDDSVPRWVGTEVDEVGDEGIEDETGNGPASSPEPLPSGVPAPRKETERAYLDQKAVNTKKYRQGPPVLADPSEATQSSDAVRCSSPESTCSEDVPSQDEEEDDDDDDDDSPPPQIQLPYIHKKRASAHARGADEDPSSPPARRPATPPNTAERERKRQKRLADFKDVVTQFAHVVVSPGERARERDAPEDVLANMIITEPFPGAATFGLCED